MSSVPLSTRTHRHAWARPSILVAALAWCGLAPAQTLTYTPSAPQTVADVVPAGVGAIKVTVLGGAGGAGSPDSKRAGSGAAGTQLTATIRVVPGQSIAVVAGNGGQGGATYGRTRALRGGLGGSGDGAGGAGETVGPAGESGGGGGGGGASSLSIGSAWVRAGGGGGGGGDSYLAPQTADAVAAALFTADAANCATPAPGTAGTPHLATQDGGGGGGGGGGYLGAAGAGGNYGLDSVQASESGGMGGSCTWSAAPNAISSPVASVPGAPAAANDFEDPNPDGAPGSVSFEYIYLPTVTLACDKSALFDSASQQALCTVTASSPAPVGGLSVPFTVSAAHPQYSTQNCTSPALIPEGQTQAPVCTITAANNQVVGEGPVTASLQISDTSTYITGTPAQADVTINDDDTVTPVVTISCDKSTLTDSAAQQSLCTITASSPAPASGLAVALALPPSNPRYTTSQCTASITLAAGMQTATACVIDAVANTVAGDGAAQAEIAVASGAGYTVGTPGTATVAITDDDSTVVVPPSDAHPVPALGMWGSGLLALLIAALGLNRRQMVGKRQGQ